jgi:hypothetical protein
MTDCPQSEEHSPACGQRADVDALYLNLKGARENLCLAQMKVADHWRSDVQTALDIIDQVGSSQCPQQWSKYDQPEYAEPKP